ncbi:MAG: histidinol-phosphate transaminase [Bacteroidales bacterium]|nr:histidinol-phosphate transaminase [Bacteroidales bacterium]
MNFDLDKLIRPNLRNMIPYSSARDEYSGNASVFLDANESPFNEPYNRYPDPQQKILKSKISKLFSQPVENIFLGNGSDEAIDLLFRVFCEPGRDNILTMAPSYGMYEVSANTQDVEVRKVLLEDDYTFRAESMLKMSDESSKLAFLCSPNNPTGNLLDIAEIIYLLGSFEGIVVVDEAYIDFAESKGLLPYLQDFPNLVVLRTFSKAWGLAGIRLGMAFASSRIINLLAKVKYPYNLNILTQEFALKQLMEEERKKEWVSEILFQRAKMAERLRKMKMVEKVHPSDANFLLVKLDRPDELYNYLKDKGIIIRDRSKVIKCEGSLRITIGSKIENKILLREMEDFMSNPKYAAE